MGPISFEQTNIKIAEHQDEYLTLPAHYNKEKGVVTSCWKMSFKERLRVLLNGRVFLQNLTFGQPLQPIKMSVRNPLIKNTGT
jgi:hypothetical protein